MKKLLSIAILTCMAFSNLLSQYIQTCIEVNVSYSYNPFAITLSWVNNQPDSFLVYKKNPQQHNWDSVYSGVSRYEKTFTDYNVEEGTLYEYGVKGTANADAYGYVLAGAEIAATEDKGTILLLVDSTFTNSLETELQQLEFDLIGSGWNVIRDDIKRDASPLYVKSVIQGYYDAAPTEVKSVFLLGHIPLAMSGYMAPDGHEARPWPADMYYGDVIEGSSWTWNEAQNKFNQNSIPGTGIIDIAIGRVDFYNLPAFSETEEELLRRYLKKNHDFKHTIIDPPLKALEEDNFGPSYGEYFGSGGYRSFFNLVGQKNVAVKDFGLLNDNEYLFSFGCGPGRMGSCANTVATTDYAAKPYYSVFNVLFGSYFGQWDGKNNLMRASLANSGYALTCFWSGRPYLQFHQMGMDYTVGEAIRIAQNNKTSGPYVYNSYAGYIHPALMGDPTLCMYNISPVRNINSISNDGDITLYWTSSDDIVEGYYVYRYNSGTKEFEKISGLIKGNSYKDENATIGDNVYMIKAYGKIESKTGSFYKYSQGIYDTVNADLNETITPITNITIESSTGSPTISIDKGSLKLNATYLPANASIPNIIWSVTNQTGIASIKGDGIVEAYKDGTVLVKAEAIDGSGIFAEIAITLSNQIILVEDIIISRENGDTTISINEGGVQLFAEVLPDYATIKDVGWNVLNQTGAATITKSGVITGTKTGLVWVAAFATDESEFLVIKEFMITDAPVYITEKNSSVQIYPNPALEFINIVGLKQNTSISLINLSGQVLLNENSNTSYHSLDVSSQPMGVYFLQIKNENNCELKKVIIK